MDGRLGTALDAGPQTSIGQAAPRLPDHTAAGFPPGRETATHPGVAGNKG